MRASICCPASGVYCINEWRQPTDWSEKRLFVPNQQRPPSAAFFASQSSRHTLPLAASRCAQALTAIHQGLVWDVRFPWDNCSRFGADFPDKCQKSGQRAGSISGKEFAPRRSCLHSSRMVGGGTPPTYAFSGITLPPSAWPWEQNTAQSVINRVRFSNRSPRRYAASVLSPTAWAKAASDTSLG